ncbi:nucleotide pyrophosphohydrolase [Archaeoglobales archaeon]|nr:MAG: nucleotide pyrophosphohydrolase [Archaeoglobales archaeon]
MEFKEIQTRVKEKYYKYDVKSGHLFLLAVLFEEVGELAEAVRKKNSRNIQEELVDVMFMVLSIANLFSLDLEDRFIEKYITKDPSGRWDLPI